MVIFKTKEGIVPPLETQIIFTDVNVKDSSILEVYFTDSSIRVVTMSQDGNNVYVTISSHLEQVGVKLFINNVDEFSPYDDSTIKEDINTNTVKIAILEGSVEDLGDMIAENTMAINGISDNVGNLSDLETTNKNSLVEAINENFTNVSNGKTLIAEAITDKGVETSATDSFQTMATNISNIEGGGGGGDITNMSLLTSSGSYVTSVSYTPNFDGFLLVQFYYPNSGWDNTVRTVKENGVDIPFVRDRFTTFGGSALSQAIFKCKSGSTYTFTCNRTSNYAIHKLGVD